MLQLALSEFSNSTEYAALSQYYEAARASSDATEKLLAVKLFQETLGLLLDRKSVPVPVEVSRIQAELHRYVSRLSATVDMLTGVARPVPKIMHFVWVGGSEVGTIQRDYMNIWREVLKSQDYKFNLWYDSDALLAFEMNRVILDSARIDAMESGGAKVTKPSQLAQMIEDRARVLKHQMFDYLNQPKWAGRADQARIDLMVRAYGKDRATLEAFRQRCLETHLAMAGTDLQLRDVHYEFAGHFLQDVYQREVAMRGNFAAASDVVRLQAEHMEGGRYSDMDYLPPLADKLGGVDISAFSSNQRLGVLQLLLNHNEALMPGRDQARYEDRTGSIPSSLKDALVAFACAKPDVGEVFVPPHDTSVPHNGFRMGTQIDREMNAHFLAHPDSGMTLAIKQLIRFNYDCLYDVERRAAAQGISWAQSDELSLVIESVLNEKRKGVKLGQPIEDFLSQLGQAIYDYYKDGIRVDARSTIAMTGPGAAVTGLKQYIDMHLLAASELSIQERLRLAEGYNVDTEEEKISGWTVNDDPEQWLAKEQEKWSSGKLKSRYAGQFPDLLKEQTLSFKRGWPVIEGKPVLLTPVLQQLMHDLGDPFIRALKDKLTGDITFHKAVSIGFDTRQQIRAQPDHELPPSHGAESTSNLNELLTRVAHRSLAVEQLSPLLRVMLGGMFGAASVDTDGFASTWKEVVNLATQTGVDGLFARYNAIERALHLRSTPAFEAGLASAGQPGDHTARELKVLAFNDPLTLQQWGERIGQINSTAQREYRRQIFRRGRQVGAELFEAGAISARQLPQDLLMRTPGDPGRRCYPLALMMAAALALGDSAERALIGRVANASLAAEDADSRALLSALDELQSAPFSEVGTPQGSHGLEGIAQVLEAKAAPTVLLLDTGNHALLVAKTLVAGQTAYRFYEPNFAIYGFSRVQDLRYGIQRYLKGDEGAMARLYGLADGDAARFNVVELNTQAIADKMVSSNTRLDRFLQNAPIFDASAPAVWEKQAVGRHRSLSENARMGASLAHLDGHYWAREFSQTCAQLRTEHKLSAGFLPLLDTVQHNPDASYSVTWVDARDPQITRVVTTTDARLSKLKQHVQRLVTAVRGQPSVAGEADGGSRLSFAFAIQTLVTEMRNREYQTGKEQVPTLSIALQVQVYVSYAQLVYGVLSDSLQIINLVRQVAASEQALALRQSSLSGRLLGRAAAGIGVGFSAVNVGFDVYGLTVATHQEQRSRLATQLVFDVTALALDITALAVGGTVGAAAAILSVPLLGVGIGVTAIASNLGQISDKAKAVGAHLRKVQDAYGPGVYTRKDGVLTFEPEAVITELDLQGNRIRFDSQKFYPMDRGGLELPQFNIDPKRRHQAIDIREALGLPEAVSLIRPAPGDVQTVVLPCTPLCYYGYEYQLGTAGYPYQPQPGELEREPRQASEMPSLGVLSAFSPIGVLIDSLAQPYMETWYPSLRNRTVEKLEYDKSGEQRFYLFANTPFPHILYKLHPFNKPTQIRVTLDDHVRQLLVPALPEEWKQCISYEILTRSPGVRQLWLTPGLVAVYLRNDSASQWIIHAPWASEDTVRFEDTGLAVDGIRIEGRVDFIELGNGELFSVDLQTQRLVLMSITLQHKAVQAGSSTWSVSVGRQTSQAAVLARVRALAAEQRVAAAHIPLHKLRVPMSPAARPAFVTAWYDVARARLLYARNLPNDVSDGAVLGSVNAGHAWFYHPEHATVWRVDVITGTVNHRYRLMNPASGSRITAFEQTSRGLRVRQKMLEVTSGVEVGFEYLLYEMAVVLTGIDTSADWSDYTPKLAAQFWHSLVARFTTPRTYADGTPDMAPSLSAWGPTGFVQIRRHEKQTLRDLAWIRLADRLFFQLDHDTGLKLDTVLLTWDDGLGDYPLFYSKQATMLFRQSASAEGQVMATDVIDVSKFDRRHIATREDGRLYEIDKQGQLQFVGVGAYWLKKNTDWLSALAVIARQYRTAPFPIIGLSNVSGTHSVAAWCINEHVVLTDVGSGRELALLGLNPDSNAAWLLDVLAGELYRQALVPIAALRQVFTDGTRFVHPGQLPAATRVWSQWSFTQVVPHGQGLLGQTYEGVQLELLDQQPARIVGLDNQWSYRGGQTAEHLRWRLNALLRGKSHAPVLQVESFGDRYKYFVPELDRLFDVSGRADGQWAVFLGTRNESVPMLYDPVDGLMFTRGAPDNLWLADCHARRDGKVLTLEMQGEVTDVVALLPDGVDKVILAFGSQTSSYCVSDDAWQRLDCIVVDSRRPLDVEATRTYALILDMAATDRLLVSLVDGNLVLADPDNAHSLIVRDAEPQSGEPVLSLQMGIKFHDKLHAFPIRKWIEALSLAGGDNTVGSLVAAIQKLI
ncbi:hypothetical protein HU727_012845 [Pseudomonas sp. SWRI153]|uniref:Insecticidal toxin n=1 Tax=Pseudomonas khorasanensis TaxID=2745508 RepID=A0A923F3F1_9PSED|nr:TcdA/TcdB pore-forming domain-containing protein [Pseudomonas khorasanensis]MBV4486481.1 hypothetical protein [Pseudomonas khorasanensis]